MPYIKPIKEVIKEQAQTYLKQMNLTKKQVTTTNEVSEDKSKYYGSNKWKQLRNRKLKEQPLCELCLQNGITKPAKEVHHTIKFYDQLDDNMRWLLFLDPENTVSVCSKCHKAIHKPKQNILWPIQRNYLDNIKNHVSQKYFDQGIIIRWTNDANFTHT